MPERPTSTLTFLFTDIEGSTHLWQEYPQAMRMALARHDELLRQAIEEQNGRVFKTIGDAFCASFASVLDALTATLTAQRALHAEPWGEIGSLRVRMALHTGPAEERDSDFFGFTLSRVARILSAGHGGQILLSQVAHDLVEETLPPDVSLKALGSYRLKDLQQPESLYQLLHADLPSEFPRLRSLDEFPNNLPRQLTSFIGREKEIEEIKRCLQNSRLVTLTGAGGCGKSRLAVQVAADLVEAFPDGVRVVDLAALRDPALVPQTVAAALGVKEQPGRPLIETLTNHIMARTLLLLLDSCEHLVESCAHLSETLLQSCPKLKLLATSREALAITGEMTYRVPSLSLPAARRPPTKDSDLVTTLAKCDSVRLFLDRATAVLPAFTLTDRNALSLAQVCRQLDGIPLAIELAAARVKVLSVEQIAQRLEDRFRLLTGGSRTALPRYQTLQAAIDWSYDLLSEAERTLLRRLSVFVGGWTLEAAEAICVLKEEVEALPFLTSNLIEPWEVLDLLTRLVDKSLVIAEDLDGIVRYRLLETLRQYGSNRLMESGEPAAMRAQHRDWFLALAEEAEPHLQRADQGTWLNRLEIEHDNLRAALKWCQAEEEGAEAGLRLAGTLGQFWFVRGYYTEGRESLEEILARPGPRAARAKALIAVANLANHQSDYPAALSWFEQCLSILREAGDKRGIAMVLNGLGNVKSNQGDYAGARLYYEQSLSLRKQLGDMRGIAASLHNLGLMEVDRAAGEEDYAVARRLCEQSLSLLRQLGDRRGVSYALNNLGRIAVIQGDFEGAKTLYAESLTIKRELGNRGGVSGSLQCLGMVALRLGHFTEARSLLEESLTIRQELGDRDGIAECLESFAAVVRAEGKLIESVRLYGAAEALRETIGSPLTPSAYTEIQRTLDVLRERVGDAAYTSVWIQGRALTQEQALVTALQDDPDERKPR